MTTTENEHPVLAALRANVEMICKPILRADVLITQLGVPQVGFVAPQGAMEVTPRERSYKRAWVFAKQDGSVNYVELQLADNLPPLYVSTLASVFGSPTTLPRTGIGAPILEAFTYVKNGYICRLFAELDQGDEPNRRVRAVRLRNDGPAD